MMNVDCLYDDSLEILVDRLVAELSEGTVKSGVVLRDASGRLAFFSEQKLSEVDRERVSGLLNEDLGPYARTDRVLADRDAPGSRLILDDRAARLVFVKTIHTRYVDRRIVGADWLRRPATIPDSPARVVFASLKGGVGRSTALSVVAADQARRGRNVLVVDFDLEAPGVGSMLLGDEHRPELGALDYMVESNLREVERDFLERLVGTSRLTDGAGQVDVVPVIGRKSEEHPENFLAKLSRGMIESLAREGAPMSVTDKLVYLITGLEERRPYDLVMVDARAGMAELAASPLLGLGANCLLFGTSQPQTLQGLRFLFAHFASLSSPDADSPWRLLKMIHAKASHPDAHERLTDDLWSLFLDYIYEQVDGIDGFSFNVTDPDAPHHPIAIALDTAFTDWDPVSEPSKLMESYYSRTFGDLLRYVEDLLKDGTQ